MPNLDCNLILHLTAWMTEISNYPLDLINDSVWQRSLSDEVNELGASQPVRLAVACRKRS